ncbi:siderophore-interacting protein [Rhodococcus sp. (in: high G+C Gram-positive bacteria)]|uniref:siderophore-interacting protein n=1 Tax=Rhodococcus sp. TaxID=1831 RepID=UPI00258008DB|nr:siderophore-interacting protein [Rhodococcus sp. (in: high G+C Gram-positive bacteria)]MBQ7804783.1 siderophore-interacting protein [Rhodococcus sp. (in: high G+C Gram-positive bacteria)]
MPRNTRPTTAYSVTLRELEVRRVTDVTPGMRRVTLTGAQLDTFTNADGFAEPAFVSTGFDDDLRLLFAYPGETDPVLPVIVDGTVTFAAGRRPLARAYTVRRYDPRTSELDVDFVVHGGGVATTWARDAGPGDRMHIAGPSVSQGLPEDCEYLLVVGDETAIPAIARLLEELPADARGHVFVEIADSAHIQSVRELPGVSVTWLPREGAEPGTNSLLLDAVSAVEWPDGRVFAWLAGEQATIRSLRRHLIRDRGIAKTDIDFTGYWKRSDTVRTDS